MKLSASPVGEERLVIMVSRTEREVAIGQVVDVVARKLGGRTKHDEIVSWEPIRVKFTTTYGDTREGTIKLTFGETRVFNPFFPGQHGRKVRQVVAANWLGDDGTKMRLALRRNRLRVISFLRPIGVGTLLFLIGVVPTAFGMVKLWPLLPLNNSMVSDLVLTIGLALSFFFAFRVLRYLDRGWLFLGPKKDGEKGPLERFIINCLSSLVQRAGGDFFWSR